MPELAEVETVRKVLINWCKGKRIKDIECFYPLILENTNINELRNCLLNKNIDDIKRHGKHLIFFIEDYCLLSHLRMEGKYFLYNDLSYKSKHNHLVFKLDNNTFLAYNDTRKFGRFNLVKKEDLYTNSIISSLGKEPFDTKPSELYDKSINYKGTIKEFLLDQHVMAGLGNIYVDEVCFDTKLLPFNKVDTLTLQDCTNIINSSIKVLNKAIELGGSSVHSFTSGNGVDGRFQNQLNVYGRENKECKRCGTLLTKTTIASRSTIFCPYCQTNTFSKPKIIGITGLIATGKSYTSRIISEYGYKIIDCDKLVVEAYQDINIIDKLDLEFKTHNKDEIRLIVKSNKDKLKLLESIIHPFVINRIKQVIKDNQYYIIEASQLFESKLNKLCDFIIITTSDDKIRFKYLKNRNPDKYKDFSNLNNDNNDNYKKIKLSNYVINTTKGGEDVNKQVSMMFTKFL